MISLRLATAVLALSSAGCGPSLPADPAQPLARTPARYVPQPTSPPAAQRRECVLRGRLEAYSSVYSDPRTARALLNLSGLQRVERVSPPPRFGGRALARLKWPIMGPAWLGSERLFALTQPLQGQGITIKANYSIPETRLLPDGRIVVRVDLGEAARPRYEEQVVACEQLHLRRYRPLEPYKPVPPDARWATFSKGNTSRGVPLSLEPGGPVMRVLPLHTERVTDEKDGWVKVEGNRGIIRYAGWVPISQVEKQHTGEMGGLGLLGTKGTAPWIWMLSARPMALRLEARPGAPVIATLAPRVKVRPLGSSNGFVQIMILAIQRSDSPRVDHPANKGFYVTETQYAVTPVKK